MPAAVDEARPGYQAALDYLYSFINYENKMPPSADHARFNHARIRHMLHALGGPQERFRSVVVAGTKGKGSTSAMIEAMARAAGFRTGFYSSPHLHSWRERIRVGGRLITQAEVVRQMERMRELVIELPPDLGPPTTFEIATALAFAHFAEQGVDLAVLEIGLGGRYDTVNVVTPLVSVITPISFDHMGVLGSTLEEIAGAKAGILKPGVPAIIASQAPEAEAVIRREAGTRLPLWQARDDGIHPLVNAGVDAPRPYPVAIERRALGLAGPHQVENARVAVGATMLLADQGMVCPPAALAAGLRDVRWPGRFEIVEGRPRVVIDGAMNGASAARLRAGLAELPHERLILVLGTSRDKDIGAIAAELVPGAHAVIVTRSRHPRSAEQELVAAAVEPLLHGPLVITEDIPPALEEARALAGPDDLICVAGSLFVAAAAREALGLAEVVD